MNRKLIFFPILIFIIACSTKKKEAQKEKMALSFIDSTDFKYFDLKAFDIKDWYQGKIKLKALTKKEAEKYYQYRLRSNTADTTNYLFYSLQKNIDRQKIITIIDGATGSQPNLRMLIYDEKDILIGFYPVAGIAESQDWNIKIKVTSMKENDSIFESTRIDQYVSEFDANGKVQRDSTITRFRIELGYMKGAKVLEEKKYKLE